MRIPALMILSVFALGAADARADAGWEFCSLIYLKGAAEPECNFRTFAQCQAAISGLGESCITNPYPRLTKQQTTPKDKRR